MDVMTPEQRSYNMSRIGSRDTKPEKLVRTLLHNLGYRFRLHRKDLPGSPDIVLPKYKSVFFVHGCYWHRHEDCRYATIPRTNTDFWLKKFARNVERDKEACRRLNEMGWKVMVVWECETKNPVQLSARLQSCFEPGRGNA